MRRVGRGREEENKMIHEEEGMEEISKDRTERKQTML